jgi:hypothetical protein
MAKNMKAVRAHFRELHDEFLVIPNAWSVGEIGILEKLGFKAIATTSVGLATSLGRSDLSLSRDETLANILLAAGTDLPINADYEAGFADEAEAVAGNVAIAAKAGISGLSIEDRKGDALYDLPLAVERIKAARAAVDMVDPNIVLVGRTKGTGNEGDRQQWRHRSSASPRRGEFPQSDRSAGGPAQSQYPANTDGQTRVSGKRNGQPRFLAGVLQKMMKTSTPNITQKSRVALDPIWHPTLIYAKIRGVLVQTAADLLRW